MMVSVLLPLVTASEPRHDPETGKIRLLFTGELHANVNLFADWYRLEPRIDIDIVPCSTQDMPLRDARRQVRMYMPRTYDQLVSQFDCILLGDLNPEVLAPGFTTDLKKAVVDEGLGAILVEFVYWFGNGNRIDLWMISPFYDIVPADITFGQEIPRGMDNYYQLIAESDVLDLPGIETYPMNIGHHGAMQARPGSKVLARWRGTNYDCVTFSTPGNGAIIQIGHGWDNIPAETTSGWRYLQDYAYNLVFATTRHEIPKDLELVRKARSLITRSDEVRSMVFSVLEFAEMFGAKTRSLAAEVALIDEKRKAAENKYIQGDYEGCAAAYDEIISEYEQAEEKALRLKDRALLWVYLIEWLAVSGTSLLSGSILYSLMVKKRMYRQVALTRAASKRRSM